MYFRKKTSGGRAYLQIVESRREGAQVRQQVIATLGRVEDLRESGQLERLLRSGARFAAKAIVVDALNDGTAISADVRRIGPGLVFERLWEETGCRRITGSMASRVSSCIISIGRWLGSAKNCRRPNRMAAPRLHRAVSRTSSKNVCSRGGATCSPSSILYSWIRPVSISRARAARRWAGTAIPRIIGRTCAR